MASIKEFLKKGIFPMLGSLQIDSWKIQYACLNIIMGFMSI